MENPIKVFNPLDVRNAFVVLENSTHKDVFAQFAGLKEKRDKDLENGFTVYINENDGQQAVYNKGPKDSKFILTRMILDNRRVSDTLHGKYDISGNTVDISVDQESGNPMVSCRVFLNDNLISSRSSPFDLAGQQTDAFLRNLVTSQEGDAERLQKTILPENSPYPLVNMMLKGFGESVIDTDYTKKMFDKLSAKDRVTWNKK